MPRRPRADAPGGREAPRGRLVAAALLLPLALGACASVEKTLVIESTPPGAEVRLDGRRVGTTPYRARFESWGTRGLVLEKEGHLPRRESLPLDRPWWQTTPLDLFFEVLYWQPIRIERTFSFALEPEPAGRGGSREEARALYARLQSRWARIIAAEADSPSARAAEDG